jgi:hypothetical protein
MAWMDGFLPFCMLGLHGFVRGATHDPSAALPFLKLDAFAHVNVDVLRKRNQDGRHGLTQRRMRDGEASSKEQFLHQPRSSLRAFPGSGRGRLPVGG